GGLRFRKDSAQYELFRRWIAEGMHNDLDSAPKLERLEVSPREKILVEPANRIQLQVEGTFSDGTRRDLTRLAVYETANTLVKVTPEGLVQNQRLGETTVLVR